MLNSTIKFSVAAVLAFSSISALAQNEYYGANVGFVDADSLSFVTLNGKVGTYFSPHLSGEARLGVGIADDNNVSLDYVLGVYGRAGLPVAPKLYPYGVLGITNAKLSAGGASASETDLSIGVGVEYTLSKAYKLSAEYINLTSKNGVDLGGLHLGFSGKF